MNGLPDRAGRRIEGYFTMVETRGQRAGGPHAPEGITTITRGVVIAGAVKGGEGPGHRRRGRRDDRVETTCPDGRSNRQGQGGAVVGEVGGGFRQGEREHPGERVGAYRRDRLGRRCGRGVAVGGGRRCALARPRGRVAAIVDDRLPRGWRRCARTRRSSNPFLTGRLSLTSPSPIGWTRRADNPDRVRLRRPK